MKETILGVLPMSLVYIAVSSLIKCLFSTTILVHLHSLNKLVVREDITHAKQKLKSKRLLRANEANKNG